MNVNNESENSNYKSVDETIFGDNKIYNKQQDVYNVNVNETKVTFCIKTLYYVTLSTVQSRGRAAKVAAQEVNSSLRPSVTDSLRPSVGYFNALVG